jgi:hypothetical protein
LRPSVSERQEGDVLVGGASAHLRSRPTNPRPSGILMSRSGESGVSAGSVGVPRVCDRLVEVAHGGAGLSRDPFSIGRGSSMARKRVVQAKQAGSRRTSGYFTGTSETSAIANAGDKSGTKSADLQGFSSSPLTDSNRRPPPYHRAPGRGGRGIGVHWGAGKSCTVPSLRRTPTPGRIPEWTGRCTR